MEAMQVVLVLWHQSINKKQPQEEENTLLS
jgi:hypothetical protein